MGAPAETPPSDARDASPILMMEADSEDPPSPNDITTGAGPMGLSVAVGGGEPATAPAASVVATSARCKCKVCGQEMALNKSGFTRKHRRFGDDCPGGGASGGRYARYSNS